MRLKIFKAHTHAGQRLTAGTEVDSDELAMSAEDVAFIIRKEIGMEVKEPKLKPAKAKPEVDEPQEAA
mgnify:CR=1 FL=1